MYFNINEFKNCDFKKLSWKQKYSVILIVINSLLPILNLDKMNNIDITYNNIKTRFSKENFILTSINRKIYPNKFFIKKIDSIGTFRDFNKTTSKFTSLSSNSNYYKTNTLFQEQNPVLRKSYSLLKIDKLKNY